MWGDSSVGFYSLYYISAQDDPQLSLALRSGFDQDTSTRWSYQSKVQADLYLNCPDCHDAEIQEAELFYRSQTTPINLSVGRGFKNWSRVDREWSLGALEPRHQAGELSPTRVGLSGFTLSATSSKRHFSVFVSPLHVPDRASQFSNKEGRIFSSSPWFLQPPEQLEFLGATTPIHYRTHIPPIQKILLQPSFALSAGTLIGENFSVQFLYADLPMNQLALSYDAILRLDELRADVDLYPRIVRHQLLGAELNLGPKKWGLWSAVLAERPYESASEWDHGSTFQKFSQAMIGSLGARYVLDAITLNPIALDLSWLYIVKAPDRDVGPLAQTDESIFPDRFFYKNALRLRASAPFLIGKQRVDVETSFTREVNDASSILQLGLKQFVSPSLQVAIAADVLGAPSDQAGFIGRFRANDRLRLGVDYVF